ncbi:hypothetical protein M404DRAFT_1006828 [Pisolithus tinctorius Marx 270]|uniref:Secreted protein n=1 Tax=Pisolithus tinctorius Marx 270 TaxID=870435 RepID=A0A0C3NM00_PISTI|nr:hypothetical protein M404DRAFT_1006828 [Pisolithus tinctorius Marx 270]
MSHLTSLSLAIAPLLWWLHISEVMCRMPYQHGHGYMVGDDGKVGVLLCPCDDLTEFVVWWLTYTPDLHTVQLPPHREAYTGQVIIVIRQEFLLSCALGVAQTQGSDTTNVHWQCTMVINCICEVIWACGA